MDSRLRRPTISRALCLQLVIPGPPMLLKRTTVGEFNEAGFFRIALLLALAVTSIRVSATPLSPLEADAVRQVVVAQLQAFAEDDADSAFETATPDVREAIGNSGRFLAMVRGAYPMVYRPAAVAFLKPQEESGTVLQMVHITDGQDKSWIALFALERQPDSTWRISGCIVAENPWRSACNNNRARGPCCLG